MQHGKFLPHFLFTHIITLQALHYDPPTYCIGKICSSFTPAKKKKKCGEDGESLAQRAPNQLPSLHQPNQTATHTHRNSATQKWKI